jgi:hypothetical protein
LFNHQSYSSIITIAVKATVCDVRLISQIPVALLHMFIFSPHILAYLNSTIQDTYCTMSVSSLFVIAVDYVIRVDSQITIELELIVASRALRNV